MKAEIFQLRINRTN